MATQSTTLRSTNAQLSGQGLAPGGESSPLNDEFSCLAPLRSLRQGKQAPAVNLPRESRDLTGRLDYLKTLARGRAEEQQIMKAALKESGIPSQVCSVVRGLGRDTLQGVNQVYDLLLMLSEATGLTWYLAMRGASVVLYLRQDNIFPGVKLEREGDCFYIKAFSYNIRFN